MMKKHMICCAVILMTALLLSGALAATDPVDVTISVSPESMTAPGKATVSIRVTNLTLADLTEPVSLYDPDGKIVSAFGDGGSAMLAAEGFYSFQAEWDVTQAQLDAGAVVYTVRYNVVQEDGTVSQMSKPAAAQIAFTGEKAQLEVKRSVTPAIARKKQQVTVLYELVNTGNVTLTDIKVKENSSISSKTQTVKSIEPGKSASVSFSATMASSALTSAGTVTYADGAGKTQTVKLDSVEIPLAAPKLSVSLTASSSSINIGDAVTLTLTLKNDGNVSYSNVTVKDAKQGEVFSNVEVPAGVTVEKQKEFILTEPTTFKFSVELADNTGSVNTLATNDVTVSAYDPSQILRLSLNLTSDQITIPSMPAVVKLTLTVTNSSDVTAKNVAVTHGATSIYTITELAPAQTVVIERDFSVSQAGKFQFVATCKDSLNNTVTFSSNELQITYAAPTATPSLVPHVTVAPPVTIAPPTEEDVNPVIVKGRDTLFIVLLALAGVLAVSLLLWLAASFIRLKNNHASNSAYDHLDLKERRDYTEPPEAPAPDSDDADEAPLPDKNDMPHDKYLLDEPDAPVDAPVRAPDTPEKPVDSPEETRSADGMGAYRLSRAQAPAETAEPVETAATPAEAPAEQPAPARHRRARKDKE